MTDTFIQTILFSVKPDKTAEFEELAGKIKAEQKALPGCISAEYMKRAYTFDGVELGEKPREIMKIVKCVKYYAVLTFDTIENCGAANGWFFENYCKSISKLLIVPFDINSGYTL